MSEVKRFKPVINSKPYKPYAFCEENEEGIYVRIHDYAALKAERDALAAKGMELCREAAHVYEKYNVTQMPDMDLVDCQTIQEFSDLAGGSIKTDADAYTNQLRAEVIKDFCQLVGHYGKVEPHHFNSDFADLYAKINKEIYESILDNPAVYDMESLVDWLERGVNDSRAYADMALQHAANLRKENGHD